MNGPHDMGGMQCYGPVIVEPNEPSFHGDWEKKAMALTVAMGFTGSWNLDASRFARESIPPGDYTDFSYYEIWLAGIEKLMLERGMVTTSELTKGASELPGKPVKRSPSADEVPAILLAGGPVSREPDREPQFSVGAKVRTKNMNPSTHTRLPRYARNAPGIIEAVCGFHVFPDSNARGKGENPQWLYTVKFQAGDLFGDDCEPNSEVHLDLWEPYLVA